MLILHKMYYYDFDIFSFSVNDCKNESPAVLSPRSLLATMRSFTDSDAKYPEFDKAPLFGISLISPYITK